MGKEVVNLDGTQRQKRQQLQVQTGAERGGKAVLRSGGSEYRCSAGANGFVAPRLEHARREKCAQGTAAAGQRDRFSSAC